MSKMINKIGFFGGSFDPIHNGHIQLALQLIEKKYLDKILFCPTALSPFKIDKKPIASNQHRLKMLKLAIQAIPEFEIIEHEIHQENICYTIDTIKELKKQLPKESIIRLILGADMLSAFTKWKDYKELLSLSPPLAGARSAQNIINPCNIELVTTNLFDISSTEIRKRIHYKQYIQHLLPQSVINYITKEDIYI